MSRSKTTRKNQIEEYIVTNGEASVLELCERFHCSEATIRRYLNEMGSSSRIRRVRGGAVALAPPDNTAKVLERVRANQTAKRLIGKAAAALINDGETVFLGSGSTVLAMVEFVTNRRGLTVISNSLPVISRLSEIEGLKVVVVGGILRSDELSIIGHIAEKSLEELRADRAFVGAEAVHPDRGLTHGDLAETMTDRAILNMSPELYVLADHSKFNRVRTAFWTPVSSVTAVITDYRTNPDVVTQIREAGTTVLVAESRYADFGSQSG